MDEASWALVGVTVVLVLLTGWYAIETRRIVRRMDREREELTRPILTFQLIPWQPNLLKLRIQNVGNGPALGVKGTIETVTITSPTSTPWSYPLLNVGKFEEFGFPMPPGSSNEERFRIDKIRANVVKVRAEFTYKSVSGHQYELKDTIQVKNVTDDWVSSQMMATRDHPERLLPRIAEALENLVQK